MAKEEYKSERTKRIEKAKEDKDMPAVKRVVKGAALGISRAADKVEGFFKSDKDKEDKKKMAKGGITTKTKPVTLKKRAMAQDAKLEKRFKVAKETGEAPFGLSKDEFREMKTTKQMKSAMTAAKGGVATKKKKAK
jgi:hypothetical protein